MDQSEARDLLQYLRQEGREVGLESFDERVMSDLRRGDLSPRRMLLTYLEALDAELALRSGETARHAVDRMNSFTRSYEDAPVEGAEVRLGPADARLNDAESVDLLTGLPDFGWERAELGELIASLREIPGDDVLG
jgi:hypothetical protein